MELAFWNATICADMEQALFYNGSNLQQKS
jgi:hypothetical protein